MLHTHLTIEIFPLSGKPGSPMSTALRIAHGAFGRVALLDMDRSLVRHAHPLCHVLIKADGADTQFSVGDNLVPLTDTQAAVSYTHLRAHETRHDLVCRLLL